MSTYVPPRRPQPYGSILTAVQPPPEEPDDLLLFTPHHMPPRAGGWSAERQVAFVECLRRVAAACVSVALAAAVLGGCGNLATAPSVIPGGPIA